MSETEQSVTLETCPLFGHQPQTDWATRATGPGPYLGISGAPIAIKFYSIICPGCCSTASFESRERAITAWNSRASAAGPQKDASYVDGLIEQLTSIDSPCDCESAFCDHWKGQAGVILTGADVAGGEAVISRDSAVIAIDALAVPVGSDPLKEAFNSGVRAAQEVVDNMAAVSPSTEPSEVAREAAREWMNTHHASFETNKAREDALAIIITKHLVPSSAQVVAPQGDAFTAYNQAIEDALAAIRAESQGGGYWAATYINAIARKCSPHVYVASLPVTTPVSLPKQFSAMCVDPECWVCKRMAELHAATTPTAATRSRGKGSVSCV